MTASAEQELRKAGANDELIQTLRQIQPQGLVWGAPHRVASADHGLYDVSNLVTEGGKHFLAFTGDDKHVRLASDASGTWKIYDVYSGSDVGNGANRWYVSLVVNGGEVYVPFVTWTGSQNVVAVAYNANLQSPWSQAAIFSTEASYLNDPFGMLSGGTLLVSFDTPEATKGSDDVYVASIPVSALPAGGAPFTAPLAAQVSDVSKVDDVPQGPADDYAEVVPGEGSLLMAWQRNLTTLALARGHVGGPTGTAWPLNAQLLNTSTVEGDQSLQLAARGQTAVIARFDQSPNQNSGPACCDVWATTNASGSWATQNIGGTNKALQRPGVAVSACGPSVAFQQAIRGSQGRLTVATFEGGRWVQQSLAMDAEQPRLSVTPDGLDMTYQSGYGGLFFQHAKCYPPPARLYPGDESKVSKNR